MNVKSPGLTIEAVVGCRKVHVDRCKCRESGEAVLRNVWPEYWPGVKKIVISWQSRKKNGWSRTTAP